LPIGKALYFQGSSGVMKHILSVVLFFCLVGCASTDDESKSVSISNNSKVDSPAAIVVRIDPKYPQEAFDKNIEGYIVFDAIINEGGKLEQIEITESQPKGVFDAEALRALKYWFFKPAVVNGKTVKVKHQERLEWKKI
jgi:protein TonB